MGFQSPPITIQMEPLASDPLSFSAEIPAAALAEGALLRWAAAATAALPGSPQSAARCPRRGDDWLGTAVLEPTEPSNLPVMEWFRSPNSSEGGSGDWVWFAGVLRPLAAVSRKGATSLGWPKPKLKLEFKKGCDVEETDGEKLVLRPPFVLQGEGEGAGAAPMSLVDLDSLWVRVCVGGWGGGGGGRERKKTLFFFFFLTSKNKSHTFSLSTTRFLLKKINSVGAWLQQLRQTSGSVRGPPQSQRGETVVFSQDFRERRESRERL